MDHPLDSRSRLPTTTEFTSKPTLKPSGIRLTADESPKMATAAAVRDQRLKWRIPDTLTSP